MELQPDKTLALKNTGNHTSENPMNFVDNFEILDLSKVDKNHFFSFNYSRKTFYTATLLQGKYSIEFEDKNIELNGNTLLFTTSKIPFGIHTLNGVYTGISCIFKEDFITKNNSGYRLLEFPIYKPGRQNIYSLTDNQAENFTAIYAKILDEKLDNGNYKESLQRNYLLELIFNAQKFDPVASYVKKNNTTEEIACSFIRLLESQFPINNPQDVVKLKTAGEFAEHLSLHPNYLNRQVKLSKGRTVSDIINSRIEQEAKILLKLTNWNIAQIANSLGFEEPSHFNTFFKKHTKISPTDYRKLKKD
ncbi:helix-turn-helix transcriptional regulator [Pedobacter sp. ISL-68]|uniref:AraC family transcriptional regulator n=1 Tax=unclassified Pedobacter TaxID=2628915 RepID=UPI001BE74E51|nr:MULTISPECIES: AraC family transcriptional regulator [unclassified Pedobacter]MBT2561374.1 helix-turn-helix transcriptional regulator [Pedobacter sp. ISL-64]MBT2590763.1 helix-turn-helix transcriptional regulator [Pedobacter sp. ISL-68]